MRKRSSSRWPTRAASSPGGLLGAVRPGVGAANLQNIATFGVRLYGRGAAEPLVDLAVLAAAKALRGLQGSALVQSRVYSAA